MRISVGLNSVPGCRWLAQITNVWLPGAQGDLMQLSIVWKLSLISKKLNLSSNLDIFSWMTSIIHVSLGSVFELPDGHQRVANNRGNDQSSARDHYPYYMILVARRSAIGWFCTWGDRAFQLRSPPLHRKTFASVMWCDSSYAEMTYLSVSVMSVCRDRDRRNVELPNWPYAEALKMCIIMQSVCSRRYRFSKASV